jgi:hypothetical protein
MDAVFVLLIVLFAVAIGGLAAGCAKLQGRKP